MQRPELFPGMPIGEGVLVPAERDMPPVPLRHTSLHARVVGPVAAVQVVQQFVNAHTQPLEAFYCFPLPDDATVTALTVQVGDRRIVGVMQRRAEAEQTYAEARANQQVAALLQQERPNLFVVQLANLQPGATIDVQLALTVPVPYDDDAFTLTLPTVVTPRYTPPDQPTSAALQPPLLPATRAGHTLSVTVELDVGRLADIASPSHPVTVTTAGTRATVTLQAGTTLPNKDFVLHYRVAGDTLHALPFTYRPTAADDGTLLLTLVPPVAPPPDAVLPREVLFVLDRSGSMAGAAMEQAKLALHGCLRALNPGDTFNIIAFDHQVEPFTATPQPFTQAAIDRADSFVAALYGRGGTEIIGALQAATAQPRDAERLRVVVFLTDGAVGNEDAVLRALRAALNEARVFAFGIGAAVNHFLLHQLAVVGRGAAAFILPGQSIEAAVEQFQRRASLPVLVDLALEADDNTALHAPYPQPLPDLYSGQALTLLARFRTAGQVTLRLRGRTPHGDYVLPLTLELPAVTPDRGAHWQVLPRMWARARVAALLAAARFDEQQAAASVAEVTQLGQDYHIVTPYTSLVAVEERSDAQQQREPATSVVVPIHLPEGTQRWAFEPRGGRQPFTLGGAAPQPARFGRTRAAFAAAAPAHPQMDQMDMAMVQARAPAAPDPVAPDPAAGVFYQAAATPPPVGSAQPTVLVGAERVALALRYLARTQDVDGMWQHNTTVTVLALLAFLQHGHSDSAGSYRPQLRRTVQWLVAHGGQPTVAPLLAWALAELAATTQRNTHVQLAAYALQHTTAHDNLDAGVLDYARHAGTPAAQCGRGLRGKAIASYLTDERGVLALVIRGCRVPDVHRQTAQTFASLQQTSGSHAGAVLPPDTPPTARTLVQASTAAAVLFWGDTPAASETEHPA